MKDYWCLVALKCQRVGVDTKWLSGAPTQFQKGPTPISGFIRVPHVSMKCGLRCGDRKRFPGSLLRAETRSNCKANRSHRHRRLRSARLAQKAEGAGGRLNKQNSKRIGRAAARRPFCLLGRGDLISTEVDRASRHTPKDPLRKCRKIGTISRPGTDGDGAMTPIEYLAVSCLVVLILSAFAAATAT